jgi:hypothetical protein
MQIIYFLMRAVDSQHWNISLISSFTTILSHLSVDHYLQNDPELFQPMVYISLGMFVGMVILVVWIAFQAGWRKMDPLHVGYAGTINGLFLFTFKTILVLPLTNLALVVVSPSIAQSLNIHLGVSDYTCGMTFVVFFLLFTAYIVVFFRENNPFS